MRFDGFDRRKYGTLSVKQGYRLWSESYDRFMIPFQLDYPLMARCRELRPKRIKTAVDLGCGTGRIGAWLKGRGAGTVDGLDVCAAMLARARAKNVYRRLLLRKFPGTRLPSAAYDLVICSLALCHVRNLRGFYREASRLAKRTGSVAVIDYHPHFLLNGIPTHFQDAEGRTFAIRNYVHLFRDHFAAADRAGWALTWMDEMAVPPDWARRHGGWRPYVYQPVAFMLCWNKK